MSATLQKEQVLGFPIYTAFSPEGMVEKALQVVKGLDFVDNEKNKMTPLANLHEHPQLVELHSWFSECIQNLVEDLNLHYPKTEIVISWANRAEKGESHQRHSHNMSVISGVYYLTEGRGGNTVFFAYHNLWKRNLFYLPGDDKTYFQEVPEKGKLILFPSIMLHQVMPHGDEEPRYTIAFNAFPKGQFGSKAEKNYLEIR